MPSLSIVIPIYNEPDWIGPVVGDLAVAVARAPYTDVELVVVDDGSAQPTRDALAALAPPFPVRVLHQENAGRFAARRTGVAAATGDMILLVDSRVSLHPDALAFAAARGTDGGRSVWNGHVDIDLRGNPFARFWNVLTDISFRHYFGDPRTTSFGLEEFDLFPKGTTCFLAPRDLLLGAIDSFASGFADLRDANDDTILIRWIAERQRINIGPGFRCTYRSRDALKPFLKHAYHRGGVFVDGYGRPGTRFFPAIAAFYPSSLVAVWLLLRRPRLALTLAALGLTGGAGAVAAYRRSAADGATMAGLGAPFVAVYGLGMWRGLFLLIRAAAARGRRR